MNLVSLMHSTNVLNIMTCPWGNLWLGSSAMLETPYFDTVKYMLTELGESVKLAENP